ncbi:hypothetical protein [Massilia sp. 9I]|uniref:hypothetical protein n=1 Tax=Massilia sp. 9I TaxID=2653152 RepID=UPI0012F289F1|nr:hypothetical protein [Massilia sp. 9I]VXB86502.1 conserved hypothetical protein [Massilia sp. 9I]
MPDQSTSSMMFDIPDAGGVNESEKILSLLCQKSFLSLWSFSNLFTDEDLRDGRGSGKELCDVLAVFGDDVIIFSDKHIHFQHDKEVKVAWGRWYKRAVSGSISQLYGAMNWLKRFPRRAYLDAKCTRPLPVEIPAPERARYHLIAVTRGTLQASKNFFNGRLGTPLIDTSVKGDDHFQHPFVVGLPSPTKHFVHVFDEVSLELIHEELDTIADLTAYLRAREELLTQRFEVVAAAGEEQLLAAYLMHMNGDEHAFLPENLHLSEQPSSVYFEDSFFERLKTDVGYLAKKKADKISYSWDWLIEKFIRLGDPQLVRPDLERPPSDLEKGLRLIAGESRLRRRTLAHAIRDNFELSISRPSARRVRLVANNDENEMLYVFLISPINNEESYDAYRRRRAFELEAYCRCAKLRFPKINVFVGMAFDHPAKMYGGSSEDLMVVQIENLSQEEHDYLEKVRAGLGILNSDMTMQHFHASEYPYPTIRTHERTAGHQVGSKGKTMKSEAKRRRMMAIKSRKRNRK